MMSMRQRTAQSSAPPAAGKAVPAVSRTDANGSTKYSRKVKKQGPGICTPLLFVTFIASAVVLLIIRAAGGIDGLRGTPQPKVLMTAGIHEFAVAPQEHRHTFWVERKPINNAVIRAFRDRQWTKVNNYQDAHFVWTYSPWPDMWKELKPWQRYNHLHGFRFWNSKDTYVEGFKNYELENPGTDHYFNPETYRLVVKEERDEFHRVLTRGGGINHPWVLKQGNVNQGKGITMVAPNSKELLNVLEDNPIDAEETEELVIQRYVCNELTWDHRKYDVRMFWLIASVDPLLVLYHDGYVRIGNAVYDETDFSNTRNHLTTHTFLAEEGKATFEQFKGHLREHNRAAGLGISDPVSHVRNQFKEAIGTTAAVFKDTSFNSKKMSKLLGCSHNIHWLIPRKAHAYFSYVVDTQNGIGFYGADFILDQDLDVYFLEPQMGCGMDEDWNFRVEMHDQMFRTMVDVLDEIIGKQEKGENLLPLKSIGKWQVVYADGWIFKYEGYKRSNHKKDCALPDHQKKVKVEEENDDAQ
jgi:hypothetical protein